MVCSPARLAANRINCLKSTGPAPESRHRTCGNAFKHGLTGAGVVLPGEDREAIERRFDNLFRESDPQTEREVILLERGAYLSIRLLRCQRHANAMQSIRVRHAVGVFHQERIDELNRVIGLLEQEPELILPQIRSDPDGLDWLMDQWSVLREVLMQDQGLSFGVSEWTRMRNLLGERPDPRLYLQETSLIQAIRGCFDNLEPADVAGISDEAKPEWSRGRLLATIDHELATLKAESVLFDYTALKQDQDEAEHRLLFDPSKEAILSRRYEAATERSMLKTFREFDELAAARIGAASAESKAVSEAKLASKRRGSLASFFPSKKSHPKWPIPDRLRPRKDPLPRESRPCPAFASRKQPLLRLRSSEFRGVVEVPWQFGRVGEIPGSSARRDGGTCRGAGLGVCRDPSMGREWGVTLQAAPTSKPAIRSRSAMAISSR